MTVGEMLSRMTSSELTEWRAYFGIQAAEREMNKAGGGELPT